MNAKRIRDDLGRRRSISGNDSYGSVYKVVGYKPDGDWLATIWPTYKLKLEGGWYVVDTNYHGATAHETKDAAMAAYVGQQIFSRTWTETQAIAHRLNRHKRKAS